MSAELEDIVKGHLVRIGADREKDRELWVPLVMFGLMSDEAGTDTGVLMNRLADASGTACDKDLIARTKAAIAAWGRQ